MREEQVNSLMFDRYLTYLQRSKVSKKIATLLGSQTVRVLNVGDKSLVEVNPPVRHYRLQEVFAEATLDTEQRPPAQPLIQTSRR
jgi:hypothetical protein